jgi:cell division protein FtsB
MTTISTKPAPKQAEPKRTEPRRAEPKRAEPKRAAAKTMTKPIAPRRGTPRRGEPTRGEPRRAAQRPAPREVSKAAPRATPAAGETARETERFSVPPRAPFVLLVVGLMAGALVSLLLLNTVLAQDAFSLSELQRNNQQLVQSRQALQEAIAREESPAVLAQKARALGMVPNPHPAFIDAKTGRVIQTGSRQPGISNTAVNAVAAAGVAGVAGPVVVVPGSSSTTTTDGRTTGGNR